MITLQQYLQYQNDWHWDPNTQKSLNPHIKEIQEYNKALIDKYPFLLPRNRWTGKVVEDYDYDYTELDEMPDGWRIRFGAEMVEEISQELKKYNFENEYRIMQIKEKWGGLRWYDNGYPRASKIDLIIYKYEDLSYKTCIICGKPAIYQTTGWVSPYCADCVEKTHDHYISLPVEDEE
jgi:hypothetical protein